MNIKHYQTPDGQVKYSYSLNSKKWEFVLVPVNQIFLTPVPGRAEMAAKIANVLLGSIKRAGGIDGLARANIAKIVS